MSYLTGDDLARPAKDLPLKVIRDLGQMLHKVPCTSGSWEMIAEDLGYGYEEIKQFNTMSNTRQEKATPGELMMRDWVQLPIGRTLFVLHSALHQADMFDCVEYLESEIYKRIVCMELIICVRYEDDRMTIHKHVTTRADSSLLDSLHGVLDEPVQLKYKLLDHGVSWTRTLAREIKGRQLMLLRKQGSVWMEQDPTIDSSGIDLTVTGDHSFITTSQGSCANSDVRTRQVSLASSESRSKQSSCLKTNHISDLRTSHITDLKIANTHYEQNVSGSMCNEPDLTGNMQELHSRGTVLSHATEGRSRSQSLQVKTVMKTASGRLVGSSGHFALCSSVADCNNLNCLGIKNSASSTQQKINISISDGDSIEDNSAWAAMDCDYNPIGESGVEADSSECRDFSEYRESSEQRDLSKFKDHTNSRRRVLNKFMDSSECKDPIENTDSSEQRDTKEFKYRTHSDEYRDLIENSDYSEYRDPRGYCDYGEYRDASEYRDPTKYKDAVEILHDGDYKDPDNSRYTSGGFDTADFLLATRESEQSQVSEITVKQAVIGADNATNIDNLLASSEGGQSHLSETDVKQAMSGDDITDTDKCFDSADYQYAENYLVSNDDSITMLKQRFGSSNVNHWDDINVDSQAYVDPSDMHLKQITPESVDESNVTCNSNNQYFTYNDNAQLDFNSETCNAHPDFERDGKDLNVDSDMNMNELGLHNEHGAVKGDTGNSLIECSGDIETYLDFNKYYQGNVHADGSKMGDEVGSDPVNECEKSRSHQRFARIQHRPPRRYISEAPGQMSNVTRGQQLYPYESLQREMSCPSDFVYEKSLKFSEEHHDMVTIADVFSPVTDESKMKDFERADRGTLQASSSSSTGSVDSALPKRHSLPVVGPCQNVKKSKHQRHTIQHCDNILRFGQELSGPMQDSPPLPPRGRRSEIQTGTSDTIQGSEMSRSNSNVSMQSAPESTRDTRYVCKIVIGGKTSRPPLDGLLADDKLFIHYNTTLQGFPGWSPRETENTIEKTMRDAVSSDGYYIIWYTRGRKTLVLSVRGSLVNYRVHTKVMMGKLHYYVTQGRYFEHVVQLLQHYQHYGVRAGCVDGDAEYRIQLGCPVLVQYERKPAVSV